MRVPSAARTDLRISHRDGSNRGHGGLPMRSGRAVSVARNEPEGEVQGRDETEEAVALDDVLSLPHLVGEMGDRRRKVLTSTGPRRRADRSFSTRRSPGRSAMFRGDSVRPGVPNPDHRGRVRCHDVMLYWASFSTPVGVAPLSTISNTPSHTRMVGLDHGFFFGKDAPATASEISRGGGGGAVVFVSTILSSVGCLDERRRPHRVWNVKHVEG